MVTDQAPLLNPWLSMWTKPRRTMRQILDNDPRRFVLLLAAIGGVSRVLDRAAGKSLGDRASPFLIFVVAILAGSVVGIISLYVSGWTVRWTGRWFGGAGSVVGIRAAIAWPNVLVAWSFLLWIPVLLIAGNETFTTDTPRLDASPVRLALLALIWMIDIVLLFWYVVVIARCVAEAQAFSAWRGLANVIVAGLVIAGSILFLALALYYSVFRPR